MSLDYNGYSFLFAALAEKHNAVIRKIREIPPWEWGGEFLDLEPKVLRFLDTFAKRYPECAAFKTAYTLVSALAVYRRNSRKPRSADGQPDAQPTNRRIKPSCTNPFWREVPDTPRQNRDDDQRQKSSMPIRTSAAETT